MRLTEFAIAVKNSKILLTRIEQKYPQIDVRLVLSCSYGYAPIDSSLEYLLDQNDYLFIENLAVIRAWAILDLLFDKDLMLRNCRKEHRLGKDRTDAINEIENQISALNEEYQKLIPSIEIHNDTEICLQWVEIDYDINRKLRRDSDMVDISRTPQIGGIKICLGTSSSILAKTL